MFNGFLLACVLAVPTPLQSVSQDPPPASVEWNVREFASPTAHAAHLPNLTRGADGVVYMTWVEPRAEGLATLLVAHLADGEWTPAREVVQSKTMFVNWADFPGVCALEDGTLLAYWLQRDGTPHGYTAETSLSSDRGKSWSPAKRLHEDPKSGEHGFVSVAAINENEFLAIWLDGRNTGGHGHGGGSMQLLSRTVNKDGTLGAEQLIDDRVCDCCQTSLIVNAAGEALVAYRDRDAEEVRDISESRYRAGDWSKPSVVREDGWLIQGCPVNGPQLTSHRDQLGIAWFTGAAGNGGRVYARFANGKDSDWGFALVIDNDLPVGRVDLEFIDSKFALVTWLEAAEGSMAEWRARPILGGVTRGEDFVLGQVPNERASGFLRMTSIPGGALAAWTIPGDKPTLKVVEISVMAR